MRSRKRSSMADSKKHSNLGSIAKPVLPLSMLASAFRWAGKHRQDQYIPCCPDFWVPWRCRCSGCNPSLMGIPTKPPGRHGKMWPDVTVFECARKRCLTTFYYFARKTVDFWRLSVFLFVVVGVEEIATLVNSQKAKGCCKRTQPPSSNLHQFTPRR